MTVRHRQEVFDWLKRISEVAIATSIIGGALWQVIGKPMIENVVDANMSRLERRQVKCEYLLMEIASDEQIRRVDARLKMFENRIRER